jgi:hypothetical protein
MRFESLTPRVPVNYLLLIAALVWTFAGGMLLYRGNSFLIQYPDSMVLKLSGCLFCGLVFYWLLFNRISLRHVFRIKNLPVERPCAFSFFDLKSYLMMAFMISGGIALRRSGVISPEYLALIYITMGIPLLLSSFRFYYSFFLS